MKKTLSLTKFLLIASILLVIGFILRFTADMYLISIGHNSAPFWLFLIVRGTVFLIPAAGCFAGHVILKNRAAEKPN